MREVLVVDNELEICTLLKATFEDRDEYRVHAFDSGEAALASLATLHPDLALIDVLLPPPVSGSALALRISALDVPVLFMSGHPEYVSGERALEFPLIGKPFRFHSLVAKLDRLLGEHESLRRRGAASAEDWRRLCERTLAQE